MPAASATESFRRTGLKRALRLPDDAAPVKQNAFQYKAFYMGYDNTSALNRSNPSRQAPSRAALRPVPGTIGLTRPGRPHASKETVSSVSAANSAKITDYLWWPERTLQGSGNRKL